MKSSGTKNNNNICVIHTKIAETKAAVALRVFVAVNQMQDEKASTMDMVLGQVRSPQDVGTLFKHNNKSAQADLFSDCTTLLHSRENFCI